MPVSEAGEQVTGQVLIRVRRAVTESVLAALRAGQPPTAVVAASPFSEIYVRKLARENGIPDYPLRRFPQGPRRAGGEAVRLA